MHLLTDRPYRVVSSTTYKESALSHMIESLSDSHQLERLFVSLNTHAARQWLQRYPSMAARLRSRDYGSIGQSVAPLSALTDPVLAKLGLRSTQQSLGHVAQRLDAAVAERLSRLPSNANIFIGMPYSSEQSFATAKSRGMLTVFNHVNGNKRTENSIIEAETAVAPALGIQEEIHRELWPEQLVARVDQEVELADVILVPSKLVRDDLVGRGVAEHKMEVLPYGVDTSMFPFWERDSDSRPLNVVYVGQVGRRKGLQYLLEAVKTSGPEVARLTVVGPIVNQSTVLDGASAKVTHLGRVSHHELARSVYKEADVFVLPSLSDSFGLVVLEAMASGLPVIVTRDTGASELIRDSQEGFIVPARDPAAIVEKLKILAEDGDKRLMMGTAARHCAETHDWDRFENEFLQILDRRVISALNR